MKTLKVGIADYGNIKARTLRIARGEERPGPNDPKVWFTSTESFAQILSAGNRELLRTIAERAPAKTGCEGRTIKMDRLDHLVE